MRKRAVFAIERAEIAAEIAAIAGERPQLAEMERDFAETAMQNAAKYVRRAIGARGKVHNHITTQTETQR